MEPETTKDNVSPDEVYLQTEPPKKLSVREAIDVGLTNLMEAVNDLPGYGKALLLLMLVGLCPHQPRRSGGRTAAGEEIPGGGLRTALSQIEERLTPPRPAWFTAMTSRPRTD